MKTILLLLLLPLFAVAQTYDGFVVENGELLWTNQYEFAGDDVRDALLASLGIADGIQLANYQPKDKLVGKGELRPATTLKSMMLTDGDLAYTFGFTVTPNEGGYLVRVSDINTISRMVKVSFNKHVPSETALARMAQKGKLRDMSEMFKAAFMVD